MFGSENTKLNEFRDRDYREAYAESFLNTWIAMQIQAIRKQRGWTQAELAERCGTKQPGIARVENASSKKSDIEFLQRVARAFDTRLRVTFESYLSLVEDSSDLSREKLERVSFDVDPAFWSPDDVTSRGASSTLIGFEQWVEAGAVSSQLLDWLDGIGVPSDVVGRDTFRWVVSELNSSPDRSVAMSRLGGAVRTALNSEIDHPANHRQDGTLTNLLLLGAALGTPEVLAQPLSALLSRLKKQDHLSFDERSALVSALINNQVDDTLDLVWFEFLQEGRHPCLPGNEFTGWEGILRRLVLAGPDKGTPAWDLYVKALGLLAERISDDPDRTRLFERCLKSLERLYGFTSESLRLLLLGAYNHHWPDWAKGLAPQLFVQEPTLQGPGSYLMAVVPYLFRVRWSDSSRRGSLEAIVEPGQRVPSVHAMERALLDRPPESSVCFYNWLRMRIQQVWKSTPEGDLQQHWRRLNQQMVQADNHLPHAPRTVV